MLQRHQLLAEYEAVSSSGEIQKLPVFDDVIGAAQVTLVFVNGFGFIFQDLYPVEYMISSSEIRT